MANTKRTNTTIEWPATGHFTIDDLQQKYPSMVNITLRFRVKKALDLNEISAVGKIKPAIGRPRLVFVKGVATKEVLAAIYATGILPLEKPTSVNVGEIESKNKKSAKAVDTTVTQPATVTV
jgi:hypothetical protein